MVILKLLFVAVVYVAIGIWLYAHSHMQPDQAIILPALFALAANTWIVQSAFDHDYPPVKKWRDSFGIAVVVTFLTHWAYMVYLLNNYPN